MFNGDFMVGINTPMGSVTFHIKLEHWESILVKRIENSPEYDGASSQEMLFRLCSLIDKEKIMCKISFEVLKVEKDICLFARFCSVDQRKAPERFRTAPPFL